MKTSLLLTLLCASIIACSPNKPEEKKNKTVEHEKTVVEENPTNYIAIDSDEAILSTALMAAPKAARENCKVIGYGKDGEIITLREGNNEFIVLADDPQKAGFSAACYHISLEPFMARGRELKAEGKNREEIFEIRGAEVKAGKLTMGNPGSTLHIYYGPNEKYDPESGEVERARYRYVVYLPFATPESTGLPIQPVASNHPWIMDPGTHRAHIMISPINGDQPK